VSHFHPDLIRFISAFSLILSCVVIGVSISLLFAPKPESNEPPAGDSDAWLNWTREHDLSFRTRDSGPYYDYDGFGFRNVPILGLVASASNFVIVAPL
jgi:hypothetical protein